MYKVVAIAAEDGVGFIQQGEEYFRVVMDNGWMPEETSFIDIASQTRWLTSFQTTDGPDFDTIDEAILYVRNKCRIVMSPLKDVTYVDVMDVLPRMILEEIVANPEGHLSEVVQRAREILEQ